MWDGASGHLRNDVTGAVYVKGQLSDVAAAKKKARGAAHVRTTDAARQKHAKQQKATKAKQVAAARDGRKKSFRRACCNDTLLAPGFDLTKVAPHDGGHLLQGTPCFHCGARLFKDEVKPSKRVAGQKRGRSCCSDGVQW